MGNFLKITDSNGVIRLISVHFISHINRYNGSNSKSKIFLLSGKTQIAQESLEQLLEQDRENRQ